MPRSGGVAGGLSFLQRAGCTPGGQRCRSDGGGLEHGRSAIGNHGRPAIQGRGAAGASVVCFLSFLFLFCSFGDEPRNELPVTITTKGMSCGN